MLALIEIFLTVIACLCFGAIYAVCGYKVTNIFTDGPDWRPWEQALFWLVWPIIIPAFFIAVITLFLAALLVSLLIAFIACYDLITSIIKKLSK